MTERITLDLDAIEDQARKVGQLAAEVSAAAGIAQGAGMTDRAFGNMGSFLNDAVSGAAGAVSLVANASQGALSGTAQQLRSFAAESRALEQDIAQILQSLEHEIGN